MNKKNKLKQKTAMIIRTLNDPYLHFFYYYLSQLSEIKDQLIPVCAMDQLVYFNSLKLIQFKISVKLVSLTKDLLFLSK